MAVAKKKSVAIGFLKRANRRRYGGLWSELENSYTRGQNYYRTDLTGAYNLLLNYKAPPSQQQTRRERHTHDDEEVSRMTFVQNTPPVPGTDGATHDRIKCYNCNTLGHYASVCPKDNNEQGGVQMLQVAPEVPTETNEETYESEFTFLNLQEQTDKDNFLFHQRKERYSIIHDTWILLDSQSTVSVFKNSKFLSNIRPSPNKLRVHTNGGIQFSSQMGTVTNFGDVWFNEESLADILSMAAVQKVCPITMDTSVEPAMHVH
jgi:hypothetical protein